MMSWSALVWVILVGAATIGGCMAQSAHSSAQNGVQAFFVVTAGGTQAQDIRLLSGADGFATHTSKGGSRCLTTQEGTQPASVFLYFDTDVQASTAPMYVIVEYYDDALAGVMTLEYDSDTGDTLQAKYRRAEEQAGGRLLGTRKWKTAIFMLQKPLFAGRQNLGADFRLSAYYGKIYVRAVRLASERPSEWGQVMQEEEQDIRHLKVTPLVKIGRGGQLIIGGFDPARKEDVEPMTRALEAAMPALKQLGVTSHEGYVRWNLCEPEPGKYDWSVYDRYVEIYKRYNMKWVPFLIVGSAYSLPRWYYKNRDAGYQGYVCLEHGEESDVQSLWNPALREHVARFIRAFCEHYRDTGVIESILLGITGNYGEAIYIATGNDWTADIYGPYHTHAGYWAGDPYAVKSFQQWLEKKYGDVEALSRAWGRAYARFSVIRPFLKKDAPNDRAWLDLVDWYIGSMNEWARFWMQETRKHFPKGDIYLCTGGHAPPEHGANFGEQCKIAAEIRGGVRITNEASNYAVNFSLTRWVASAGRQYGAYYSFEPAGAVDPNGVIYRIYNATASGARGLHYYYPNLFETETARQNFIRWGSEFKQRKPVVEIAVHYPQTHIKLNGNDFLSYIRTLRDHFDFEYMSDEQILDGGLQRVKALILIHGNVSEGKVWRVIAEWVRSGGLLLYPTGMGRLRDVEGNSSYHDALFGGSDQLGRGRVLVYQGAGGSPEFRSFVSASLAQAPQLSPNTRQMVAADGKEDGVFVTLCAPNELLWLNTTGSEVVKRGRALPPHSIVSERLTGGR
ncbi:MAG: beta-galactosidase [Armatimonadota bacterium]|nr:beta-galactosidase [bacterium]MDW8319724.1 beta-galactosidase [Armatimonadota bacterium]